MAAPPNDSPAGAGVFSFYTAPTGVPQQQEAMGDLATAHADPGIPRCLGRLSFARTVWYRIPEGATARQLTIEAVGRTTDAIDLATFVQPLVSTTPAPTTTPIPTPSPEPTPPTGPSGPTGRAAAYAAQSSNLREPNACDGAGAGAGADSADHTSAVSLLVPGGFPVLVQVGRRGPVSSQADEQALVTLDALDVTLASTPRGDSARSAPRLHQGANAVRLAGATITGEDPSTPPCPALGTVWRKLIPGNDGRRVIAVSGLAATSLAVFQGSRPTGDNALDCVNRRAPGQLQALVDVKRNRPTWVRIGLDRYEGDEQATISVREGEFATVINGGSGGFDPTPGGPSGGLPATCDSADAGEALVAGPRLTGRASDYNAYTRVPIRIDVSESPVCDATLRLYGPHGHVYAKGRYVRLSRGATRVRVPRLRTFVPGRYHLETSGLDIDGDRTGADTDVTGKLKRPPRKKKRKKS
jgi:hypothetical protein